MDIEDENKDLSLSYTVFLKEIYQDNLEGKKGISGKRMKKKMEEGCQQGESENDKIPKYILQNTHS